MLARRNWLLKCSILVNVLVLLYICSHVMIGTNTNEGSNTAFVIQQPIASQQQQQSTQKSSLSQAQMLQDEQELAAIFRNKELELQKQIRLQQETVQVCQEFLISFFFQRSLNAFN
jgi:hypothetical protein